MGLSPYTIDTDRMKLEPLPNHPGASRKVLLRDDSGGFVQISYGPPGFTEKLRDLILSGPHRHYHRTVTERHYVLDGDYPVWHWSSPGGAGTLSRVVRHDYLENRPMTLHGITSDATPEQGWKILQWANGPGTEIYEPGADLETIELGFNKLVSNIDFGQPLLEHTVLLPWEAHPTRLGWCVKRLSGQAPRLPAVELVQIPPDSRSASAGWSTQAGEARWIYVVAGNLAVDMVVEGVWVNFALEENAFFAIPSGAVIGDGCITSEDGCLVISVGPLF
jgi:hypothetical protein